MTIVCTSRRPLCPILYLVLITAYVYAGSDITHVQHSECNEEET